MKPKKKIPHIFLLCAVLTKIEATSVQNIHSKPLKTEEGKAHDNGLPYTHEQNPLGNAHFPRPEPPKHVDKETKIMQWHACFAEGIYPGEGDNKGKQYSVIRGYKLLQQFEDFSMGLFQKPKWFLDDWRPDYVLAIRGTEVQKNKMKDLCAGMKIFFGCVPKRIKLFMNILMTIVSRVPAKSTIHVVGHSLGGYLAALLVCLIHMKEPGKFKLDDAIEWTPTQFVISAKTAEEVHKRLSGGNVTLRCYAFNPGVKPFWWTGRSEKWYGSPIWKIISGKETLENYILAKSARFYFYKVRRDWASAGLIKELGMQTDTSQDVRKNSQCQVIQLETFGRLRFKNHLMTERFHAKENVRMVSREGRLPPGFAMQSTDTLSEKLLTYDWKAMLSSGFYRSVRRLE